MLTMTNETLAKALHTRREVQQSADKEKNIAFVFIYMASAIGALCLYMFVQTWPKGGFWCLWTVSECVWCRNGGSRADVAARISFVNMDGIARRRAD